LSFPFKDDLEEEIAKLEKELTEKEEEMLSKNVITIVFLCHHFWLNYVS
jgi:hypothetical protein